MYGAEVLPLMLDQLWFSITITKTVLIVRVPVVAAADGRLGMAVVVAGGSLGMAVVTSDGRPGTDVVAADGRLGTDVITADGKLGADVVDASWVAAVEGAWSARLASERAAWVLPHAARSSSASAPTSRSTCREYLYIVEPFESG